MTQSLCFGARTDYFGLAGSGLILNGSRSGPVPQTQAVILDQDGGVHERILFGNTSGNLIETECLYHICSNSAFNTGGISLGWSDPYMITRISVQTANSNWPLVRVSGIRGVDFISPSSISHPGPSVIGAKIASLMGFTISGLRVNSSEYSVGLSEVVWPACNGEPNMLGVSKMEATISIVAVRLDTSWSMTPPSGWDWVQRPEREDSQAAFSKMQCSVSRSF